MTHTLDPARLSPEGKRALLAELMRTRGRRPTYFPVSFAQQRLWFLDRMAPGNPFYNEHAAVRLAFAVDTAALEASLAEIVRRHGALRTTFTEMDGEPLQAVAPEARVELPVVDLRHLPRERRDQQAAAIVADDARRPFDLGTGPLLRTVLVRLDEADYVFGITMHHIVSDGWSMGVFARELEALYPAMLAGAPSPLPELPIQYADFAVWQRQSLRGARFDEQLAYWTRQLADLRTLQLPTDFPRPAVQSFRGASHTVVYPPRLLSSVRDLAAREGATLFMTLVAAFGLLLARYADEEDVAVGVPVAGRTRPELEPLIGFFVNTLVLRMRLSEDPTVAELLRRVRETTVAAFARQEVPFDKIVERLQPERDPGRNPLFQVAFQLFTPDGSGNAAGMSPFEPALPTSKFDLTLHCSETPAGLQARFEYSVDLFEPVTIARMAEHYRMLLEGMAADAHRRAWTLPMLTARERDELEAWNATRRDYPRDRCLHELFAAQAARTPDAIAVSFESSELTYVDLNGRANRLAACLRARGVGPDVLVAVAIERSIEMVVGVLGVLKAGGAYVPVDPSYPAARIEYMLADTRAPVLLTQASLRDRIPAAGADVICVDADWPTIETFPPTDAPAGTSPDNLAYVIYTSGSTGRPKGVMIEHRSCCNSLVEIARVIDGRSDSRVLQFSSFSFDGWIYEAMMAFGAGARLCLAPREALLPGPALVEFLREHRITTVLLPASTLAVLPDADLPDLRCLNVTGEACSAAAVARWAPGRRFLNVYGPTEATCWCTHAELTEAAGRVHIGRPMANAEIRILDSHLNPVPVGVPGELYIGGDGLARGYLNQDALTRERFIPHPFGAAGARLYKSGDRARYLPGGDIELLGRIDHQVKVRGFRIEPGEIEAVMGEHPAVRVAVVICRENGGGDRRLLGYAVPRDGLTLDARELRRFLEERLPEYLVPWRLTVLDRLPVTPVGKLDRSALPEPADERRAEAADVAPRTELERAIARVWQEVLGIEQVGVHDNFFDLGGHSLLLARLHSRLASVLPGELPMIDLFRHPTIASLAARVEAPIDESASGAGRPGPGLIAPSPRLPRRERREEAP